MDSNLLKVSLRYGIFGGLISCIIFTVLYFSRPNPIIATKGLPFELILIPALVFIGIKEFRDYRNNRELRLWQGLSGGFVNYMLIALISATFIGLFITYYDQQILQDFINFNIVQIQEQQEGIEETFDKETYDQVLESLRNTTAYHIALDDFIRKVLIGFVSTLIISIILRK